VLCNINLNVLHCRFGSNNQMNINLVTKPCIVPVRHAMMVAMVVANGFILTVRLLWDLCCLKIAEFAVCCRDRSIRRGSTASAVDLFE